MADSAVRAFSSDLAGGAVRRRHFVVIGSGAGGATAAWVLAEAGHEVTVLEKGRNYFRGLDDPKGLALPLFGGDEIRQRRGFPGSDVLAEPRTGRSQSEAADGTARTVTGFINHFPATVGGATTHFDAKMPRYWKIDFEMRSRFGPVEAADLVDWPFGYGELAPWYDLVEEVVGVAGDASATPAFVREQVPRGSYPMPPGPPMYASLEIARGAERLGYEAFPFPMAINSVPYDGRPACHNCGYCSGFGCPINARGGAAVTFLRRALLAGARLVTRSCVTRIGTDARGRATHVEFLQGEHLEPERIEADGVVLAASAVESARLALLSRSSAHPAGLGNASDRVGRTLCFHASTFAGGTVPQRVHAHRGRSTSHCLMEPAVPNTESRVARWAGLPFLRGGVCELGGAPNLIDEALAYDQMPFSDRSEHKSLMRSSPNRDRMLALQMLAEDLPQLDNRVDLDPEVRDVYGLPVARITYSPHRHDRLAGLYWGYQLRKIMRAAGAESAFFLPHGVMSPLANPVSQPLHMGGTLRMGADPASSVTDEFGRIHGSPNVVVADSSVFPTFGAMNPTLTLMAVALRSATALAHGESRARRGPRFSQGHQDNTERS
ncbi:GMC family oxidoreductase [Myxococcota bacterium]|nr:GMC family oxidoreductase [Myxococcota bacterium]